MTPEGWILVPSILIPLIIVSAIANRFFNPSKDPRGNGFNQKYDPKTGIGRGAPGFQTGVKKLAVTPEIAARMRAGEDVSREEIEAAVAKASAVSASTSSIAKKNPNVDQDWLPQNVTSSPNSNTNRKKGRKT